MKSSLASVSTLVLALCLCLAGLTVATAQGTPDQLKAFEEFKLKAEGGDAASQFQLGVCYAQGIGVAKDDAEAVRWIRKAAEQGLRDAQFNLGHWVHDVYETAKWYRKAAEQGLAEAQVELGASYGSGSGVWKNDAEALKWYRKAADQGNAEAESMLGICYEEGTGVVKDANEAAKWYRKAAETLRKAAEQGNPDAQIKLGESYAKGEGVQKDVSEAVKWYTKAAEQGDWNAQIKLAQEYEFGSTVPKDDVQAFKWYSKAAEQGGWKVQSKLATFYDVGIGVAKNPHEAANWNRKSAESLRKAAEQGNPWAQNELGDEYDTGTGMPKDEWMAAKWYLKAAEQGNTEAQFSLGVCYGLGAGVARNPIEAAKWYRKAAEHGHAKAQHMLGICYDAGQGVQANALEAYKWLNLAASKSYALSTDQIAKEALRRVKAQMTREQIAEAHRLAAVMAAYDETAFTFSITPDIEDGILKAPLKMERPHQSFSVEFQRSMSDHKYHLFSTVTTTSGLGLLTGRGLTVLVNDKKFYLGSLRDKPVLSRLFWVDLEKLQDMPKSAELEAMVKTNGRVFIKDEDGVMETCYSTISQAQMEWLCSATNLEFRFEGKSQTNSIAMPVAWYLLSDFWGQCRTADESAQAPAAPAKQPPPIKPEPGRFSILRVDGKKIEGGSLYDKWPYLVTVGNGTTLPQKQWIKIQFLDSSGFVLAEDMLEAYVDAGAVQTYTETVLISTQNSPKVQSVSARFSGVQEETAASIQKGPHGLLTQEEYEFKRNHHELYLKHALLLQRFSKEFPPDVLEKRVVHEAMLDWYNAYLIEIAPEYHPGPLRPIPH